MFTIRKSSERGYSRRGWLKSHHSFSFGDYYNTEHMEFGVLRVINEDYIAAGAGFPTHSHNDMEIISYIVSGALEHQDSMGNRAVILPDEIQTMSAGTGVTHSEFNHFQDRETHILQIWITPEKNNLKPNYGQKSFAEEFKNKNLVLVVSKDGRNGSITINQNADIYAGRFNKNDHLKFTIKPHKAIWIQMIKGSLKVGDLKIISGDGMAIIKEKLVNLQSEENSEFLLFELFWKS